MEERGEDGAPCLKLSERAKSQSWQLEAGKEGGRYGTSGKSKHFASRQFE
jgi:hypothetical protein